MDYRLIRVYTPIRQYYLAVSNSLPQNGKDLIVIKALRSIGIVIERCPIGSEGLFCIH